MPDASNHLFRIIRPCQRPFPFKGLPTVHGVVFDVLCLSTHKPSPGDRRGLRDVRDRDAQVFFSIGQTLFSSGMKASFAGMVATIALASAGFGMFGQNARSALNPLKESSSKNSSLQGPEKARGPQPILDVQGDPLPEGAVAHGIRRLASSGEARVRRRAHGRVRRARAREARPLGHRAADR